MIGQNLIDAFLGGRVRGPTQGQSDRAEPELKQPVALSGLQVIVTLGCGLGDQVDLAAIQTEPLIGLSGLRLDGPVIGQKYPLRAAFDDGWRNG